MSRVRFPKPVEHYGLLNVFGENIIASEGAAWKRHRAAANHSFTERNNRCVVPWHFKALLTTLSLVWDEAIKVALQLFESKEWKDKQVVHVNHIVDITLPVS